MTTSDDGTARVWDAVTGQPVTPPLRIGGGVHHPMFSRDGRLVLAGNGFVVQVWDAHSGTPVTPPLNPHVPMPDVAFSADERSVIATAPDGRVLSWDITTVDWPLEDLAAAARLLSCREIDSTGAPVPLEQIMEGGARIATVASSNEVTSTNGADKAKRLSEIGPTSARGLLRRDWERLRSRLALRPSRDNETHSESSALHTPLSAFDQSFLTSAAREQAFAWHTVQAAVAEANQQWFAATFHLDRLCAFRENDAELRQRRAQARQPNAGVLSAASRVPPRAPTTPSRLIDLTPHYTFALTDSLHIRNPDNSFSALSAGMTNLGGIDFDVRGLVHLAGGERLSPPFPESVRGVRVGLKATRLHFLHACSRGGDDTHIASLMVHYTNALHTEIPIVFGRDVRDWHSRANEPTNGANATIAWRGTNAESVKNSHQIRLFKTTWTNPIPGVEILSLDYVSKLTDSAPFLVAITVEE